MGRDHFSQYRQAKPQEYKAFSDSLWNGFVSVTKYVPVVNRFFTFTPEFLAPEEVGGTGTFTEKELAALNPRKIGRELGKVYKQANSDTE